MKSCLTKRQRAYLVLKRAIDIAGSALGIIILSPLLLTVAIITKLTSKGPVFFRQERAGKNLKTFRIYKFRSMVYNAPNIAAENMSVEKQQSLVTPWGRFLRKTSIDEFPQLFNIFVGDMSFIGPRPSLPMGLATELIEARLSFLPSAYEVKPGLSGYSQIHLKRSHDIMDKAKSDSYYVSHMTFWFDLKIFVCSFFVLLGFAKGR